MKNLLSNQLRFVCSFKLQNFTDLILFVLKSLILNFIVLIILMAVWNFLKTFKRNASERKTRSQLICFRRQWWKILRTVSSLKLLRLSRKSQYIAENYLK